MLERISGCAGKTDRFKELERILWQDVNLLVPEVMSFVDWTKALRELREANANQPGSTGGAEDALAAVRKFLRPEAA